MKKHNEALEDNQLENLEEVKDASNHQYELVRLFLKEASFQEDVNLPIVMLNTENRQVEMSWGLEKGAYVLSAWVAQDEKLLNVEANGEVVFDLTQEDIEE